MANPDADEPIEYLEEEPLVIDQGMLHAETSFEKNMGLFPLVSVVLMALCVIAFAAQAAQGALDDLDQMIDVGALHRPSVEQGEVWRLISAMFLHGNFEHILGNLAMLYVLGVACEHAYGRSQFLLLYVFAGVVGSLFSLMAGRVSVGASGAIFGLGGALIVFFRRHRHQLQLRDKRIGAVLGFWAVAQLVLGVVTPGIDNLAHLGGLVGGIVLACVLHPAVIHGRDQVGRRLLARGGLIVSLSCLLSTGRYFVPRLFS